MRTFLIVTVAVSIVILSHVHCQRDDTRTPGTKGPEVVEAVIDLIRKYCIFANHELFLRRLAYVESQDGLDADTYRAGYNGGIWQIDEAMFKMTKTNQTLQPLRELIWSSLFINWTEVTWTDLKKPLYSGLAAALFYTMAAGKDGVPTTMEKQATFWSLQGHAANEFMKTVQRLEKGCQRKDQLELAFILDSSASLSEDDFNRTKDFVQQVIDLFDIAPDMVRVALVKYSTQVYPEFMLNTYYSKAEVLAAVGRVAYRAGGTYTGDALEYVRNNVFNTTMSRADAAKVAILVTDGRSVDRVDTVTKANDLKASGAQIFAVGVGDQVDKKELDGVASPPSCTHVRLVSQFTDLAAIKTEIEDISCKAPVVLRPGNYNFSCDTSLNAQIQPGPTGETTVVVSKVVNGKLNIYGSLTFEPSAAIYDLYLFSGVNKDINLLLKNSSLNLNLGGQGSQKCTGFYQVFVETGNNIRNAHHSTCIDNGLIHNCTAREVVGSRLVTFQKLGAGDLNPCQFTTASFIPSPSLRDRFLYCHPDGQAYIILCPLNEVFDVARQSCVYDTSPPTTIAFSTTVRTTHRTPATTQTPTLSTILRTFRPVQPPTQSSLMNPCTADNIRLGYYIFPYPPDNTSYIKCNLFPGSGVVLHCPPHKYYSHAQFTCLYYELVLNATVGTYLTGVPNPCIPGDKVDRYFPHPYDKHKFIQCDEFGDFFEKLCDLNEVWSDSVNSCVPEGLIVG